MPARKKNMKGRGLNVKDVVNFVRDHKLISKGLGMIPYPAAQVASRVAGMAGLGRKRKTHARKKAPSQRGRGIFGDLGNGVGSIFGGLGSGVGSIAHGLFGGGRKKKRTNKSIINM